MTITMKDPLAPYRRPGHGLVRSAADESETKVAGGKPAYEAFKISDESQRYLEIRPRFPDAAECPLNAMITTIRAEWRWGMAVTLIYGTTMMVNIKGERLHALFEALKDWKVVSIEEFDPAMRSAPVDEDAPIITSIEIITQQTEEFPPMNERH